MPVDYQKLGEALVSAGLTGKAVNDYSRTEVDALVRACIEALIPDKGAKFSLPYISDAGDLVIPFDADPRFHYWKPCGQSIFETLRELGASKEVWRKYVNDPNEPF
ncbi:MAG TPA: hypothetical protein PK653_07745 [Syntrophales bacterium]|jgi:hypothetical protein|nr:hypothetical protein [Syntrophales bacterium]